MTTMKPHGPGVTRSGSTVDGEGVGRRRGAASRRRPAACMGVLVLRRSGFNAVADTREL